MIIPAGAFQCSECLLHVVYEGAGNYRHPEYENRCVESGKRWRLTFDKTGCLRIKEVPAEIKPEVPDAG